MRKHSDKEDLFDRVLRESKKRLILIAKSYAPGDSSRDLLQEIVLQLWKGLDGYEGKSSLATWVYRVALNTACNFHRQHRRSFETPVEAESQNNPRALASSQNLDEIQILEDFIGSLGELDRDIFLMYVDGLSYREISDVVALDEAHLRVRISRLKKKFTERYIET